jgi:hypothetical protein
MRMPYQLRDSSSRSQVDGSLLSAICSSMSRALFGRLNELIFIRYPSLIGRIEPMMIRIGA